MRIFVIFFYVLGRCGVMDGGGDEGRRRARGHPNPKRTQNEFVFGKKTRFMAMRVCGGVRVSGAAIGSRGCVSARPRSASRHTYRALWWRHTRAPRTHTQARTATNTTCATDIYVISFI